MAGQSLAELSSSAIRLICSGQVITSVYSVVKELAENSFDAGCTSLDIKLESYGLEKIEICDSGCGIKTIDVPFVAKRHYTSKLVTTDDLQTLKTYGFRGEALASLCAVSDMSITTKTADDDISYVYDIDMEGNIKGKKPSHLGTGTTVTARNLFFNLPVRKQFYNTSQRKKDDLKRIEDLLIAFGIIKPQMRITLRHDKDIVWQKVQTNDTKGALQAILSRQVFNQLLFIEKLMTEPQGFVSAYLPKPGSDLRVMSRSTGDRTFIVINDRPVHIKELVKVLKQYYTQCHACEAARFPVCYVYVKLPSSDVDVNVDPNKTTVLLKYLNEVRICLEELLLKVYGPLDNVPNWHYSDAVKNLQDNNGDGMGSKVLLDRAERKSHGKSVIEDDTRHSEMSDVHNKNSAINIQQETAGDKHKPLQTFVLTSHNTENSPSISSELILSSKHHEHRNDDDCSKGVPTLTCKKLVQNITLADDFSQDITTENSNNHLKSCVFSKNLLNEEPEMECLNSSSISEDTLQISVHGRESDVREEPSNLKYSCVNLDLQNKQQTLDMEQSLSVEDRTGDTKIITENGRPEMTPAIWSMGHGITSANGEQLQPVQLLTPSSVHSLGKRLMTMAGKLPPECPPKQRKISADILPPGQSTLNDIFLDQSVRSMAFEVFCKERRPIMLESNHDESREAIDKRLEESWKNLSSDERLTFTQKCLEDTTRQDKKVAITKGAKNNKTSNSVQSSNEDEAAAKVPHKKIMKRRLYHLEKQLECDVRDLRTAVLKRDKEPCRIFYEAPTVIGQAKSCDVWLCGKTDELCVVNVCRLGEAVLFTNLKDKHRLLIKPLQSPVNVSSVLAKGNLWPTMEKLAQSSQTQDAYFHINDERLVVNGFDILCHRDSEGRLQAELVGLCDLVPAYNIADLSELLETISQNPNVTLSKSRPTKVLYYLQNEVYRILQTTLGTKSVKDVQEMVNQLGDVSDSAFCIHHRPVFHKVFDLNEIKVDKSQV